MKHPSNRELFEHWNARRGERLAPERNDIEPAAIRKILGDTFVLEANGSAPPMFRLAGTRLCALFARELKGESFNRLWHKTGQTAIRELISVVMDEKVGVVASVTGATSDDMLLPVNLEMLLLPLERRGDTRGARDRGARADGCALLARRQGGRRAQPRHVPASRPRGGTRPGPPPRFQAAPGRLIKRGLQFTRRRASRRPKSTVVIGHYRSRAANGALTTSA